MAVDASPGAGRVLIATSAGPLVAEPSWSRYDNLGANCRCSGFDWHRGRQSELDTTNTGTARVFFHDRAGTFGESFVGKQILLQLFDPCAEAWEPVFRGHIDDIHFSPSPMADGLTDVTIDCADIFDYLSRVKFMPGAMGVLPTPEGQEGTVFYEEGPVDGRIEELGDDAGLDDDMLVVFSGNVDVLKTPYRSDDDILSAMRDAADAEFPGVGNIYVDRFGRCVFHGRFAKFDPDGTASGAEWNFTRWDAATREDVTSGRAQIREFAYNMPRTRIINKYLAYPQGFWDAELQYQTVENTTSRDDFGQRGEEAPDLIIKEHKTNGNDAADECLLFGEYYVNNYSDPRKNIERCVFKSLPPDEDRAADVWALMSRADISDVIHFFVDEAGMNDEQYFIEGMNGSCRVGPPDYDFVTFTPNLSPAAYYTDNVFEEA